MSQNASPLLIVRRKGIEIRDRMGRAQLELGFELKRRDL
jgi:hypothetical protein